MKKHDLKPVIDLMDDSINKLEKLSKKDTTMIEKHNKCIKLLERRYELENINNPANDKELTRVKKEYLDIMIELAHEYKT